MRKFLRLLDLGGEEKRKLGVAVLLAAATVSSSIALAGTSAFLISMAALQPSIVEIQSAIVAVRLFGITRGVFRYLQRLNAHSATFAILTNIRVRFYEGLEEIFPAGIDKERQGEILNRSVTDIDTLQEFYLRVVSPFGLALLITLGSTLYFASVSGEMASLHFLGMLAVGLGMPIIGWLTSRKAMEAMALKRGDFRSTLVESLQGMADLSVFGAAESAQRSILQISQEYGKLQLSSGGKRAMRRASANLFMYLGVILVLIIGIQLVQSEQLKGYFLASMVLIALASYEAVLPLGEINEQLEESASAAGRVFGILDKKDVQQKEERHDNLEIGNGNLRINDLGFSYSYGREKALSGINLEWKKGERIAIVGPSGAGKSSLANLLMGYWRPKKGMIFLGKSDIRDIKRTQLQKHFGALGQRAYIFNASLRDNILIAKPSANQKLLAEAAQEAGLLELIERLPQGWDSWLGEGGKKLSGGERQKVALARIFLQDPSAIILDEPSAHLDWSASRSLNEIIWERSEGRSLLLITHRLAGLKEADQIFVLDEGALIEKGTHPRLIEIKGKYWQMVQMEQDSQDSFWGQLTN